MGRVEGKVAFVTGAGRGQGRAHAVRLAEEGANIIAVDVCAPIGGLRYPLSSPADLQETVRQVEKLGRRIIAEQIDIRDMPAMTAVAARGAAEFGKIDIVVGNAGVSYIEEWDKDTPEMWEDVISVNLTGAWNTVRATAPHLIAAGGGSIILTASSSAVNGMPFMAPYVASKAGVLGLVHAMAYELSESNIRINALLPGGVNTPMGGSAGGAETLLPLIDKYPRTRGVFNNILKNEITEPIDQANGMLFLASDESRFVTSTEFSVDSGVQRS